uniref:Uncharacterized protein n=1 Tax=Molossus molossus TaxID=27622 RepID=A0A7J8EE09_MOLMO|nr:hypothetical protein HJG59_008818 [Molossus molossus]
MRREGQTGHLTALGQPADPQTGDARGRHATTVTLSSPEPRTRIWTSLGPEADVQEHRERRNSIRMAPAPHLTVSECGSVASRGLTPPSSPGLFMVQNQISVPLKHSLPFLPPQPLDPAVSFLSL